MKTKEPSTSAAITLAKRIILALVALNLLILAVIILQGQSFAAEQQNSHSLKEIESSVSLGTNAISKATCTHTYEWVTTVQPTCTKAGKAEYKCKKCGHVMNGQDVPPKGHT